MAGPDENGTSTSIRRHTSDTPLTEYQDYADLLTYG